MAKFATLISFALMFSFVLVLVTIAEGWITPNVADPMCNNIHGVEEGETCSSIMQKFNLDEHQFLAINPNINCVGILVGQWVCVDGKVI